jgi:DNA-binding MarR family transcriptional regulator
VNIGREEPATGTEVAERLGSDVSTVSRTIEAVVQRGLVRQSRGTDRRVREYRLTEAGREELRNAIPRWHEAKDRVLEKVGTHSWNSTLHILKQVGT